MMFLNTVFPLKEKYNPLYEYQQFPLNLCIQMNSSFSFDKKILG